MVVSLGGKLSLTFLAIFPALFSVWVSSDGERQKSRKPLPERLPESSILLSVMVTVEISIRFEEDIQTIVEEVVTIRPKSQIVKMVELEPRPVSALITVQGASGSCL